VIGPKQKTPLFLKPVMVTSDHNMAGLENSENSSESTLKKYSVWMVNQDSGWKQSKCVVCILLVCYI